MAQSKSYIDIVNEKINEICKPPAKLERVGDAFVEKPISEGVNIDAAKLKYFCEAVGYDIEICNLVITSPEVRRSIYGCEIAALILKARGKDEKDGIEPNGG